MKELTREKTIKSFELCGSEACEICPLYEYENCIELRNINALHYLEEKEPAPSANGTSPEVKTLHIDDTTLFDICQEGLLKIGDRIAECADGDDYILGYVHAILDVMEKFKSNKEDLKCQ